MSTAAALMEPSFDMDKLSYEIFSILESKFLFGYDDPKLLLQAVGASPAAPATPNAPAYSAGRVRVLSVDAGGATDGLLAAASLARLEASLRKLSGEPSARIADFFDVAAGSGVGGVLVALLFTRGAEGRPLLSAAEALDFVARNRRVLQGARIRKAPQCLSGIFRKKADVGSLDRVLRRVFGDATLRDAVKPVLVPCYDLATGAPFLFSRAGAVEADSYNFLVREVCAATAGAAELFSVDGRTAIAALDGGVAAGNPTAAAITHVLNNRTEFPFAAGVEDLLVVSIGNGESAPAATRRRGSRAAADIVRIAGEGASDMVDQAVSMAFAHNRTNNYVRIQANVCSPTKLQNSEAGVEDLLAAAETLLAQKGVESVLFRGKRVSERTNAEKLEWAAAELVREHEGRKRCPIPVVVLKHGSPRSSSSSVLRSSTHNSPMGAASPRSR